MSEKTHDALNATLELARKLLARKGASVDELEQATAALPNAIASAERQHGALTEHRRATLVSGSDADLVKVDNEIGAAARLLDRLRAIAEELDRVYRKRANKRATPPGRATARKSYPSATRWLIAFGRNIPNTRSRLPPCSGPRARRCQHRRVQSNRAGA